MHTAIKRPVFLLASIGVAIAACVSDASRDQLIGSTSVSHAPNSLAAEDNTQHHFIDPNTGDNGLTDPKMAFAEQQSIGAPTVVAQLHGCAKIPIASLGTILSSRGVNMASTTAGSAGQLFKAGTSALGAANYTGRVPEALLASTSAMAKEFDIFTAAAKELLTALTNSTACKGTALLDANGQFTKDGISCIIGKPARDEHVAIANQAVAQAATPAEGQQIAVAALLEAAHTCE
jgi:hypothetical protein